LADDLAQLGGKALKCRASWVTSSWPWVSRLRVRSLSPLAMLAMAFTVSCSGRTMLRAISDHQQGHDHSDARPMPEAFHTWELGLHVVDVHAGADDPAPRLEQFDIGGFSTGAGAGLRPAVIDDAGALGLATLPSR
jgi:hypothetical protein